MLNITILSMAVAISTAKVLAPAVQDYQALITVFPCASGGSTKVLAELSSSPYDLKPNRRTVQSRTEVLPDGIMLVSLEVPREHRYIWLDAGGCEAKVASQSIDNRRRYYVALMGAGPAGNFEERDASIVGTLPIRGIASVSLIGADLSKTIDRRYYGVVVGNSYYIESPPAGQYRIELLVKDGYGIVSAPILTYDRRRPDEPFHMVRNFKMSEFLHIRIVPW